MFFLLFAYNYTGEIMYYNKKQKAKYYKRKYKNISKKMYLIGVTGTNGKTTTTTLLYKYFRMNNINVTLIGTNGIYINDEYIESINTTPGIDVIYEVLQKSNDLGIKIVIMEVSSHAIKQYRIYGLKFKIKALTNITQDHLDYHSTIKDYAKTKLRFLKSGKVIINNDINDQYKLKSNLFRKVYTYGKQYSDYMINKIELEKEYTKLSIIIRDKGYLINTSLLGEFNCYNILLFISILDIMNRFNYYDIVKYFNNNIEIEGRMKVIEFKGKSIIIDYAHTPDGIENVLKFISCKFNKSITVFGCGGNRDKTKRPIMGNIVSKYSDFIILTNDNPRNEDPNIIIDDIKKGVTQKYIAILDRKEAIKKAISKINEFDCLLILGRGNEEYQEINNKRIKFNDIKYVEEIIKTNE